MHPVIQLVRELIALPSVNPAFLPQDHPHAGEQRVAEFLAASAARAGLDVELHQVMPGRPNVLARLTPTGRIRQRVLLAPHLDTVGGDDRSLFQPRLHHGRVYGRGACDTKGSLASMLYAVASLAHSPARPSNTEILFVGLMDEENAQAGSRSLAASGLKAGLAIVGEPTDLNVVTAHKGDVWMRLEFRGRAAHGARPELGRNAIHMSARAVDLLETAYAAQLRRRRHPLLGCPTINVGTIAGGAQPNIVPDHCMIAIDRRTLPGETDSTVRKEIRALLSRHGLHATFTNARGGPCPPLETDARIPLVQAFLGAARQTKPLGADYFCDAAVLARARIPSVVFGPGSIAQAHTANEWVATRQLEQSARLLLDFFRSLP